MPSISKLERNNLAYTSRYTDQLIDLLKSSQLTLQLAGNDEYKWKPQTYLDGMQKDSTCLVQGMKANSAGVVYKSV